MEQWLIDLLNAYPDDGNWAKRRRMIILARWPDGAVRAAEQDARNGDYAALARYHLETLEIKIALFNGNLDSLRTEAKGVVDLLAEAVRGKYVTPGFGQSMVYDAKAAEADRFQADADPDLASYPFIVGGAIRTGQTPAEVASEWVTKAHLWRAVAVQIETVRETAKALLAAATDETDIGAVMTAIVWPG